MQHEYQESEELFHQYRDKVYGFFVDFLKNRELSRDLTQDIFVKLILKEEILPDIDDLDGYIYQMCRNLAFDHLKKAAHNDQYLTYLIHNKQSLTSKTTNQTEQKINADHYQYILQQSLDKLPEQQRVIFSLSKIEGLSHKKIALRLGISVHTVRNHLYQAMKNLKSNLSHQTFKTIIFLLFYNILLY